MLVIVLVVAADARHDLDSAVRHPAGRDELVRDRAQLVRAAVHDDDLEAAVMIEVHVQRRADLVAEVVLDLRELLGEVAHVVVVDQRERGDGRDAASDLGAHDFGAHEIAQDLRPRDAARLDERVEAIEEIGLHRDAEPNERALHGALPYAIALPAIGRGGRSFT